jgi:hypothetical protein
MTQNMEQKVQALQAKADALFKEMQGLKAEADSLLEEAQAGDALELRPEVLAKAQAIRGELGVSPSDLANAATKFHVRDQKGEDCHWCTASAGA